MRGQGLPVGRNQPAQLIDEIGKSDVGLDHPADRELVNVLGPIPELDYPIFLLAHKDVRRLPRVSAVFEFWVRELKPVLTRGEMKRSPQGDH